MMCCQLKHINHCGNYPMVSPVPICIVKYTWWLFFFAGQCISWQLYDDYDLLTADDFSGPILIGLVRSSWWTKWIIFFLYFYICCDMILDLNSMGGQRYESKLMLMSSDSLQRFWRFHYCCHSFFICVQTDLFSACRMIEGFEQTVISCMLFIHSSFHVFLFLHFMFPVAPDAATTPI